MSCNILLESTSDSFSYGNNSHNDNSNNYQQFNNNINNNTNHHHHFKRNNNSILVLIGRNLFFRRLKLIKLYMAVTVILVVLFILLKSTTNSDHAIPEPIINTNNNLQKDLKHSMNSNAQDFDTGAVPSPNVDSSSSLSSNPNHDIQTHYSTLIKPAAYPNNLTISLTMGDFVQMKNINVMQVRIKEAMKHSWDNYRRYAWGFDMLKPRSKEPDHWFNLGLTIVDSADTLIMMGLAHDTNLALNWIENELKFTSQNENSNCFELTIRILGGILSAYQLTGREKLKLQAIDFGKVLLHCYDTESKVIPYSDIDLYSHRAHPPQWNPHSSLAEVASLQLEFRSLSQISHDPIYETTTFRTSVHIHNLTQNRLSKLLPMYINPINGQFEDSVITLGARADSYYEYLLKQYLQTGIKWLEDDYLDSMDEVAEKMMLHTGGVENFTYVAEMHVYRTINNTDDIKYYNKMDHLVCFLPGTLALGYYHFSPMAMESRLKHNLETPSFKLNSRYNDHLRLSQDLARTCYHMYKNMGTGLSGEIATFVHASRGQQNSQSNSSSDENIRAPEIQVQSTAAHNILRPEFVESLFYLYHITGLDMYRDQASEIFESFQKYTRISSGYSPVSDVRHKPPQNANIDDWLHKNAPDRMESFWLSETLKYLYLVFCDDGHIVGSLLNNYVFNTEAHLMPIPSS